MKNLMKWILVVVMSLSMCGLSISYYVERIYSPMYLNQAISEIDLMYMIKEKVAGEEYAKVLESLIETDEFKTIVYDYAMTFVHYLCGEKVTYTISDDQEAVLFKQYSSTFLDKYPQLKILPTDLFIDFLVERIDLNEYLPTFLELKEEIPSELFTYKDFLMNESLRLFLGACLLVSWLLICLLSKRISFYTIAFGAGICGILLYGLMNFPWTTYLPESYLFLENALVILINELQHYIKYSIIIAMGCLVLEWGKRCAKKIFLF